MTVIVTLSSLLFAAITLSGIASVQSLTESAKEDLDLCKEEHNVSDSDMERMNNKQVPETPEGKCFLECLMNKVDLMSGDKMNAEGAKGMIAELENVSKEDKDKMIEVIDECEKEIEYKENENCENSVIISECISNKATKKGVKPPESV